MDKRNLQELSDDYDIPIGRIKNYHARLMEYSIYSESEEEKCLECLEMVVSDASSNKTIREGHDAKEAIQLQKPLSYSISDALLNTYGEEVIPYLDEDYVRTKGIKTTPFVKKKVIK